MDDACENFEGICTEDGSLTSDLCDTFPDKCEESNEEYDECAVDMYACLLEPDFELCESFPSLCGYEVDFEIPLFRAPNKDSNQFYVSGDDNVYTCKATVWESFSTVESVIESLNYFYNANITANASFEFEISMGARTYESSDATSSTQLGESSSVWLHMYVPDLKVFADYEEADQIFGDIFSSDEENDHYDLVGETWEHTELWSVDADGNDYVEDAFS